MASRPADRAPRPAASRGGSGAGSRPDTPRYRLVRRPPTPVLPPVLDDAQRAVVEHPGGPLLVLAGPGTGKTTTLVEAVVERVRRGAEPERVLVLTFSRRAADELRERITARLGRSLASPIAWTFHSWCWAVVLRYAAAAGLEPPRLLSGPERLARVRDLLRGNAEGFGTRWPEALRPALTTRGFAHEVADLLDRVRERGLDGADLARLGVSAERPEWVAAGTFLDEYLDVLDFRGELDYAGLVRRAGGLLRDPVAADVRGRYDVVLVDEYQDTDPGQEDVLRTLAGGGRDLVVVGDPDQAIYGFRGAEVSGLLEFPTRFPTLDGGPAPVLTLRVSRRAGRALLDVSRRVAERIPTPGLPVEKRVAHRALEPADHGGPPPDADTPDAEATEAGAAEATETGAATEDAGPPAAEVRLFPTVADEVAAVADLLRRAHLRDGVPWSAMAVLVRAGVRSIPVLRRAFTAAGIPVAVAADEVPVARDPAVRPLLDLLRCAEHRARAGRPEDDPLTPTVARMLLLSPLGRAQPGVLRALGRRLRALDAAGGDGPPRPPRPSALLVRDAVADPREVIAVEDRLAAPVRRVAGLVDAAAGVLADGGTAEDALWAVWDGSGWGRRLAADSFAGGARGRTADRDLDAVLALFEAAARFEERRPHAGVGTLLDELADQEIPAAPTREHGPHGDAVRLLTAHRAKGLEWDVVVVSGVQDGVWPDVRRRGSVLAAEAIGVDGIRPPPTPAGLTVDERRLFYVAVTRARRRLVVTAVQSLDDMGERPSRFLAELGLPLPAHPEHGGTALLSTGSLTARLRRALIDPDTGPLDRQAAALTLARLAAARGGDGAALVPAAHPDRWWGVRDTTPGARPVRPPDQPVALSGSAVRRYAECPLAWFLDREVHAGRPPTTAQGFGSLVHALARLVTTGDLPAAADALLRELDVVWPALGFEAPWLADREREQAAAALARFLAWHAGNDREVLGAERTFDVTLESGVRITGSVDRLEVAADGRVHVVDLKTGKTKPSRADVAADPQLGVYQLAVREGAFADLAPGPSGGAELVQLRTEGGSPVQPQEPIGEGPTWVDDLLARTAAGIAAERFPARVNDRCGTCEFRGVCPAQDAGRQVVS